MTEQENFLVSFFFFLWGWLTVAKIAQRGDETPFMETFETQLDTVLGNWFQVTLLEQRGRGVGLGYVKRLLQTSAIEWFKTCIQLLFKFSWYMSCHPVYICIQQSENHFASWSPCSAASGVPGAQSVLLHSITASQKYLIPTSDGAQKCFSTEKLQKLSTEDHKHGFTLCCIQVSETEILL